VRATFIPGFWDFNLVRVDDPDPGIGARSIAAVADDWLEGLDHRRIEVEDEGLGTRLRPEFQEIGYSAERLLWMLREQGPPEATPGVRIEEVGFDDTRHLHEAWLVEEGIGLDTEFLDAEQRVAAQRGMRVLAVIEDGVPAAYLRIVVDGEQGEIDDVYCTPDRRGSGLGSALLREALRRVAEGGAARVFIGADDDGRPKRLYARLGFRPAWVQHVFTRRP
jgi:GNAT superfamily N-acetyltransferase